MSRKAKMTDDDVRCLGEALYCARLKAAWGKDWKSKSVWPKSDQEVRAYQHNPVANIDLCLEQAAALLEWGYVDKNTPIIGKLSQTDFA